MLAIWKREVQNYFYTPIGYAFLGIFLLAGGILFSLTSVLSSMPQANVVSLFDNLSFLFMILVPMLTMRLLSEERRNKTDQLLLTSPLTIRSIVVGKFLAAITMLLAAMLIATFYVVVIAQYTVTSIFSPQGATYGAIITNYVGFFLFCACYIAIGVLISAMTENQVAAAFITSGAILVLQLLELALLPNFANSANPFLSFLFAIFSWLSFYARYSTFTAGMLSLADVLYYISFCGIMLFLAIRIIDRRRWSGGRDAPAGEGAAGAWKAAFASLTGRGGKGGRA
ncbi:MAG: ABC transporter permease [Clostridiales bacterium]|nr:ABC transporter permease [Clostridiales bacterium]